LVQPVARQIGSIGRTGILTDQDPQPRPARPGLLKIFDLPHPHVGREFIALRDGAFRIGRARGLGALHHVGGQLQKVPAVLHRPACARHAGYAVPPTVMRSILIVGIPTPTGMLCPSLPHTPTPSSSRRSLPTILTYLSASGPLPTRVALRTGRVSLPSSIR